MRTTGIFYVQHRQNGYDQKSSDDLKAVREEIIKMHALTDKSFGVNIAQAFVKDLDIVSFVIDQEVNFVTISAGGRSKMLLRNAQGSRPDGISSGIFFKTEFGAIQDLYFGGNLEASIALTGQACSRIDAIKPIKLIIDEIISKFEDIRNQIGRAGTAPNINQTV